MARIKVAQVITRLIKGGAQTVCLDLAEFLPRERYEISLVVGPETGPEGSSWKRLSGLKDVRVQIIPELKREMSFPGDLTALVKLYQYFRRWRPQVVHCHTSKAGFVGCVAARLARVPVIIYSPHGHLFAQGAYIPSVSKYLLRRKLFYCLRKFASRCATKIIALNNTDKTEQVGLKLAPDGKYEVVYNGVAISDSPRQTIQPSPVPILCTIGRLTSEKGHRYLLEAVKQVAQSYYPQVNLWVAGDGVLRNELAAKARELGIENNVRFFGLVDEVRPLLSQADIFVLPSLYEAFGLVLLEAMALKKPVIASAVNGIPEVVSDGETGLLVPPAQPAALSEAIIRLLRDKKLARQLGEAGYQRLERLFRREQMITKIDNLYQCCLQ